MSELDEILAQYKLDQQDKYADEDKLAKLRIQKLMYDIHSEMLNGKGITEQGDIFRQRVREL